jgi:hypothetical protein
MAWECYMPRLCKFNDFNVNGLFGRDNQELMPESKNLCLQNGAGSETISQREE